MSSVHTSIDIDAPPETVWEFVMDPTNADKWVTIHRGLKDHDNGNGGTHFDYENEFHAPFGPLGAVATRALTGGVPKREADASLKKLKQILENR